MDNNFRECPNCSRKDVKLLLTEGNFRIVKCTNCGLVYLLNIPDEKEIYEDYYSIDFLPEDYSQNSRFPHLREIFEINNQRCKKILNIKPEGNILDIGCGTGLFLKTASSFGYGTYGIDISQKAVSFAVKEFGLSAENKSIDNLVEENKTFDIITMWHVLEHLHNPVNELKKIKQLLAYGGILLIEVPNFNSIKFRLSKNKWKGGNHPLYHRTFFTPHSIRNTLQLSGFNSVRIQNLPYNLSNKGILYNLMKNLFNRLSLDAFLFVAAS